MTEAPGGGPARVAFWPLAACWFLAAPLVAHPTPRASPEIRFEHLTNKDGLSQNTVFAIAQDRQGFMWFGTKVGLNRYDGYSFKTYTTGLTEAFVRVLREDASGALWIGTYGGGLDRFDPETETFSNYRHEPSDPTSLSGDDVRALFLDRSDTLWIGTQGGGLNRFEARTGTFVRYQRGRQDLSALSHNDVRAIAEDRAGNLWIGTYGGGLNRFDKARTFVHFRHDRADSHSLIDNRIRALLVDRDGFLWIGTNGGLDRFDPETATFTHFRHDPTDPSSLSDDRVRSLYEDRSGQLWVGTRTGLNRLETSAGAFRRYQMDSEDPHSLSGESAYSIFEDSSGGLWIGTYNGGLNRFDPAKESFARYRHDPANPDGSLSVNEVTALHPDSSGRLWIGTYGGGLDRFDRDRQTFTHYRFDRRDPTGLSDDRVNCLLEDRAGRLWIGMYDSGLSRFDAASETFLHYRHDPADPTSLSRDYVRALFEDHAGRLWIGTQGGGLNRLDPATDAFVHYRHDPANPAGLSHDSVVALREDSHRALWIGTYGGGLNRFDPETGVFTSYRHDPNDPASLGHDAVSSIHEDPAGRLWIGTYGGGLNRFDPETRSFSAYNERNSPMTNAVLGILADARGRLWLSTNRGLTRFDPASQQWTSYDVRDGLQDVEFNPGAFARSPDGEMLFGGNSGFNAFYPETFTDNAFVPPVALTSFTVFGQEIEAERSTSHLQEIELSHEDNFFSIEFAALSYRRPEKNRYLYQLQGLDEDWIDAGSRRFASYTKVPPGDYLFRVQGSNNDGLWNAEGASLRIVIEPPFWKTPAFYLFEAVLASSLLLAAFLLQRQRLERRQAVALQALDLRRKQEELAASEQWAEELEDKNQQLEEKNQQILQAQAQLVHSEKMASLGQLVAGVAHEINNPVSFISSGLPTLRRDLDRLGSFVSEDQRDSRFEALRKRIGTLVDLIDEGAHRTSEIVDNLRAFSRLDEAELKTVDLHPGLDSTLNLLQNLTKNRIRIIRRYGSIPPVQCYGSQINQVFMNLIVNAIQAIEGEGTLTLTTRTAGDEHVEIMIRDTGCGMTESVQQKMFDPFFTTKPVGEGTGLGLSISHGILETHHATLEIDSQPGLGTEVKITLPIRLAAAVDSDPPLASEAHSTL